VLRRVFAFSDLPCHGRFCGPHGEELRVPILHLSRSKAVLDSSHNFEVSECIELEIEFPDQELQSFSATIAKSGNEGLFLCLEHESAEGESEFGARLIECFDEHQSTCQDSRDRSQEELRNTILNRSRTVSSSDLARRKREVQVVGMAAMTSLIEEAVGETLAGIDRDLDEQARRRLIEETEAAFHERLESLKAEKQGAEAQAATLARQLERAQEVLAEERARVIEDKQFMISDAGLEVLEERMEQLVSRALQAGNVDGPLQSEIREVFGNVLSKERERTGLQAREAHSDSIELLERKVERLAETLEKSQKARAIAEQRAAALEASGGGLKGIMEAGLHPEDPTREAKLALLREIVNENNLVREHISNNSTSHQSTSTDSESSPEGGIKKITVTKRKPPPLTRA